MLNEFGLQCLALIHGDSVCGGARFVVIITLAFVIFCSSRPCTSFEIHCSQGSPGSTRGQILVPCAECAGLVLHPQFKQGWRISFFVIAICPDFCVAEPAPRNLLAVQSRARDVDPLGRQIVGDHPEASPHASMDGMDDCLAEKGCSYKVKVLAGDGVVAEEVEHEPSRHRSGIIIPWKSVWRCFKVFPDNHAGSIDSPVRSFCAHVYVSQRPGTPGTRSQQSHTCRHKCIQTES